MQEWLGTLPKRLGECVDAAGGLASEAAGGAGTHSTDKVAGSTASRVEHVIEQIDEGANPLEAGDVSGESGATDRNAEDIELPEV